MRKVEIDGGSKRLSGQHRLVVLAKAEFGEGHAEVFAQAGSQQDTPRHHAPLVGRLAKAQHARGLGGR